jgi:hypothetical protein
VEPIVNLAARDFAKPSMPFIADLMAFHSEHVHSGRQAAEPVFWALLPLDLEYGWPLVAVIKDNWSSHVSGVCKGVSAAIIKSMSNRMLQKTRQLDAHLIEVRTSRKGDMENVSARERTRILGRLDIFGSRIAFTGSAQCNDPRDDGVTWVMKSYSDAKCVVDADLAIALEKPVPDMQAIIKPNENKPCSVDTSEIVQFTPDGGMLAKHRVALLAKHGIQQGAVLANPCIIAKPGFHASTPQNIAPKTSLDVVDVTCDGVTLSPVNESGAKAEIRWRLDDFPLEAFVVTESPEGDGNDSNLMEKFYAYGVHKEKNWKHAVAKATALAALSEMMKACKSKEWFRNYKDSCPLSLIVKPKRVVQAKTAIEANELILLPMTTKVSIVKLNAPTNFFLKTSVFVEGSDEEVVQLCPLAVSHKVETDANDKADPSIELFWCVPTCSERRKCNMEIVEVRVVIGSGFAMPKKQNITSSLQGP